MLCQSSKSPSDIGFKTQNVALGSKRNAHDPVGHLLCRTASKRVLDFFQERTGLGSHNFRVWKFRPMKDEYDADGRLSPDLNRLALH